MKDKPEIIKKTTLLCSLLLMAMLVFHACKQKKCPDNMPSYLQSFTNNYAVGKVIQYRNQYNELITLPASAGISFMDIHNLPNTDRCYVQCNINTDSLYTDSLYFSLNIQGNINDSNYYNYLLYIGLGNSVQYKKNFGFHYLDYNTPSGWPATNSSDTTKYHDSYIINGTSYSKVFQVILTDSSKSKPFFKQYFLNLEKGFIRFDEKYTDKIWVLN
jgi:hypothetical protein